MKKILVPIDGSDYSMKALMKAKELGSLAKADLAILFVVNDLKNHPYAIDRIYLEELRREINNQSNKIVDDAKKHFADYPARVDTFVKTGNIESEILRFAKDGGYDLIVMGSRGLGRFAKTMLGSTSSKIVNNSDISVLIVK